ncbi:MULTISPECIES: helix-turn-helix domain-containing protein [Bacillati]|uniref:helix-turn-helix domain-containing protein n=1 Tax=Bacillati TaxID=1783272 RepID=UPI00342EB83C
MEEKQNGKLLDIEINEDAESYTIQQVMKLLDVSRKTVHNLSDKGYIQAIELPYHTRFRKVYTKKSVDKFIEVRDSYVPVINIADECGVPKQKIFNLMKVNNLSYEIDKIHYKRNTAIVTPELAKEIKKLISTEEIALNTSRKSDFVYKGYALFQPFTDREGHTYRLSLFEENRKKSWGFYVNNAFLPFTEAQKNKFEPVYTLVDLPAIKSAYASFECLSFDNNTKHFIDLLYQKVGVRNLYVQLKSNGKLKVYIKEVALKIDVENFNALEPWLKDSLNEGDVSLVENVLYIYGSHKINSYYLNINTIKKIESLSAKLKLSSPEIIEKGIKLLEQQISRDADKE